MCTSIKKKKTITVLTTLKNKASYLGFNQPTGNGRLTIVTRFELQSDGARADVGDG